MPPNPLLELRKQGLYCPAGDFYVDPWLPVDRAVITHGHSDHARWGMKHYLCSTESERILRIRLGEDISLDTLEYGKGLRIGAANISLHPAGHIPGSAQVRIEVDGKVACISGDYKLEPDSTCTPFEPVKCHLFVTETTFGLPIYRWKPEKGIAAEIDVWWRENSKEGKSSVIFGYALGKAQRTLNMIDPSIGRVIVHGAIATMNRAIEASGVRLNPWSLVSETSKDRLAGCLVLAPPSAAGTPWMRRFPSPVTAFVSGWMAVRGMRRRRAVDRGFVLSDHVDWPSLMTAILETGAEEVWTTHGYAEPVARFLNDKGLRAVSLETQFVGEGTEVEGDEEPNDA